MDCIYKEYCGLFGSDSCSTSCIRYKEIKYLLEHSLIPKSRQVIQKMSIPNTDREEYATLDKISRNMNTFVERGMNLVIWSENVGNGKTSWAIKLILAYFDKIWAGNGLKPRAMFINIPEYLNRVKASMNFNDDGLEEIQSNIKDIDLLVLDDIGATRMSEYDLSLLNSIIDSRYLNSKSTIYTTNLSQEQLKPIIGIRLCDRMFKCSKVVHFNSHSMRSML